MAAAKEHAEHWTVPLLGLASRVQLMTSATLTSSYRTRPILSSPYRPSKLTLRQRLRHLLTFISIRLMLLATVQTSPIAGQHDLSLMNKRMRERPRVGDALQCLIWWPHCEPPELWEEQGKGGAEKQPYSCYFQESTQEWWLFKESCQKELNKKESIDNSQ